MAERTDSWNGEQPGGQAGAGIPRRAPGFPPAQGLYDPAFERDSCGVGFVCDIGGQPSHAIVE